MEKEPITFDSIRAIYQELTILGFSGFAGALFEAIVNPQENWKRRALRGFAGVLCAVFFGGGIAYLIDQTLGGGVWAYSAMGFLAGRGGEMFIKSAQDKFFGKEDASNPK